MTGLRELEAAYGRRWTFMDGAGGGFIALRIGRVSAEARSRGLAHVVCGADVDELTRELETQYRLEGRAVPPAPHRQDRHLRAAS
ncbi:hypothetical protein DQ384_29265 [Sphaerisporangium album]|uniref:Uncharacterized protein n=1 Tax=Sphaerisporangium album TaxID=509200 RepID=A0A367F835_9ACTN|nr:hypothetical protein [Sphaerisporangium album]RCG26528.1 hypothetical protein DQ384_29265 [Sphaerisporangium album]